MPNCAPCVYAANMLNQYYEGCVDKMYITKNAREIVSKYNQKSVPFIVLSDGRVLSSTEVRKFVNNLSKNS